MKPNKRNKKIARRSKMFTHSKKDCERNAIIKSKMNYKKSKIKSSWILRIQKDRERTKKGLTKTIKRDNRMRFVEDLMEKSRKFRMQKIVN
jgi:hypothetical protein